VIPAFNEEENLRPLLEQMENALAAIPGEVEVIVVDDGSMDGSWPVLTELAARRPWLKAIRFLSNRGQTAAMAAGIGAARGELIAFLDADLQNDPADVAKLLEPITAGRADVVCGWRVKRRDPMWTRTIPSLVANHLIRRWLHFSVHDIGCTLKVFRRVYVQDVALFGEMHRFLVAYAAAQGARITELPVSHRPRLAGASKYGLNRVWKVLIDLLTVKMLNDYGSSPAYLFGKVAALFFVLGSAAFALVAYRAFVLGRVESTPMIFIMTLMFIAGFLSLMSGLLAELNIRVLHQVGGQRAFKIVERVGFAGGDAGEDL
jgi:glycosyltransferase involved in cell wall biosynthesis